MPIFSVISVNSSVTPKHAAFYALMHIYTPERSSVPSVPCPLLLILLFVPPVLSHDDPISEKDDENEEVIADPFQATEQKRKRKVSHTPLGQSDSNVLFLPPPPATTITPETIVYEVICLGKYNKIFELLFPLVAPHRSLFEISTDELKWFGRAVELSTRGIIDRNDEDINKEGGR